MFETLLHINDIFGITVDMLESLLPIVILILPPCYQIYAKYELFLVDTVYKLS
jgi:hypothetical protein